MIESGVAVVGFGRTGRAMLDFLLESGDPPSLMLYTDKPPDRDETVRTYKRRGVCFLAGPGDFARLGTAHTVVLSPGVDGRAERFQDLRNRGVSVVSEIEYAAGCNQATIVGVTGTNGKSTTVSLIHHLLRRAGRSAFLAGNIGTPFVSLVRKMKKSDVAVLEISSFQLEEIRDFRPHVGVLLNLTPDHLDRYPGVDAYAEAKQRLFVNQQPGDFAVANGDDPLVRQLLESVSRGKKIWFSSAGHLRGGVYLEKDEIHLDFSLKKDRVPLNTFPLPGPHNLENYLAAAAAVHLLGVSGRDIAAGAADFCGLPHRMETVGIVEGVRFVNDSKATNVDAAQKAILSVNVPAVLILGGKDKGGDFAGLEALIHQRIKRVLLLGEATDRIRAQLTGVSGILEEVEDLAEAVDRGFALLRGGDGMVLLAPGCASFDMFNSFEHRGDVFRAAVTELGMRANCLGGG
ncbi:MAG TPA: UDP-N-acetylmuramoyl-L-alanine--D-glutamate ligase [Candidatus Aminicenantes bacterium]|nr:UDP-N-acetylmuramoyl-L-alanine--D-glutamate ligase [Candidatus Aminicenantes bacterium]